ncbi:MAG: hypothetical protein JSW17_01105 [Candidatus Omnitrophota bacterium]|nr:MAG: hypothetical protein JSW17_01105 [Candidatus Omnitrophota bacterium]
MGRIINSRERETEILDCLIESYIQESKPISSAYLQKRYSLPYSSATIRNVMVSLEDRGLISHVHTSSGRVPTQEGFRRYVGRLMDEDITKGYPVASNLSLIAESGIEEAIHHTLDILAQESGYTSLVAFTEKSSGLGGEEKVFMQGTRFIFNQPEFGDIMRLRNLFYALEVRISELQDLLLRSFDERVRILIGDEIGLDEIEDCSLVVSGARKQDVTFSLGLLGPMRMNYSKASSCLYTIKNQLEKIIEDFV